MNDSRTLILESRIECIESIHEFMRELATEWNLGDTTAYQMTLAIEELVVNTIRYGYHDDELHHIEIVFGFTDGTATVVIRDDGDAFDPLSVSAPDIDAPLEDRRIGGLGIYFARNMMDSIAYERRSGENFTTLTKKYT